nr:hypothetical protein [Sphaerospermopsis reniformis]
MCILGLINQEIIAYIPHFNKIGRVMDKLYKYGLTKLFLIIALEVVKKYGIDTKYSHLDSSSLHLHGKYDNCLNNLEKELGINREHPIMITQGYSRDHRSDLKQCILEVVLKFFGEYNSLLHKQSPPAWTNEKLRI